MGGSQKNQTKKSKKPGTTDSLKSWKDDSKVKDIADRDDSALSTGSSTENVKADVDHHVRAEIRRKVTPTMQSQSRPGGDGESLPDTPPNERAATSSSKSKEKVSSTPSSKALNPFTFDVSVDVMAVMLFALGLATRLVGLDQPRNVVFDEMHYAKYASMYLKGTFFFDANPPLGKLLVALSGYLLGYDGGSFGFDKIGSEYPEEVPLFAFRLVPAIFGALLTPTVYLMLCEIGLNPWAGALAGVLLLLDTAILAQSRFVLLESMMIFFALMAVLSALKMRRYQDRPFSFGWWFWLITASMNMGLAFTVKYLAFYSCSLCVAILLHDFWVRRLGDKKSSNLKVFSEFCVEAAVLAFVPFVIYVSIFYVHLSILTKAGNHDSLMTSAFQASLEGGLSSIIRGQPVAVAHGSQITLRHTHGRTCWLHSHEAVYPIRYADGRGSSHQQQISCYGYKDVNNWWIVKRPDREDLAVHEPVDVIKDGDVIQLVHGMTHRALNSHDVAAPMSPHNQEVTCYIDYNISMAAENLWKVDIINKDQAKDGIWNAIGSQVRLVHISPNQSDAGQALKYSGKVYPEWGFHQNEVVCDKQINQLDTVWNVEEHRYTKSDEDKKTLERELFGAELIPESPTDLTFVEKFLELQIKMLVTNQENVQNHNYASDPMEWPFLTRGIAYYISKTSNAQVHLLGNTKVWYAGTISVFLYCALLVVYLLRRRRLCYDIPADLWNSFVNAGQILLGGYLFHFVPFFFYDRTLFVHHYLTAYVYKIMLTAFLVSHLYDVICSSLVTRIHKQLSNVLRVVFLLGIMVWLFSVIRTFQDLSVFSYGTKPLTSDEVRSLRWKDTWDLIIHKP